MESLDHLDFRDPPEKLVLQERKDLRVIEASLDCKGCLAQLGLPVKRVHLVPPEPMGSLAHLDPGAHLVLMVL